MLHEKNDVSLYADVLVSLCEATNTFDRIENDLAAVVQAIEQNEEISRFLGNTTVRNVGKIAALEELFEQKIHPVLLHFLLMLQEIGILSELHRISELFFEKAVWRRQETSGQITAAKPILPEKIAAIEQETSLLLGKKVHLHVIIQPELIGGLIVQVGDFIMDGTVDYQLEQARKSLLS